MSTPVEAVVKGLREEMARPPEDFIRREAVSACAMIFRERNRGLMTAPSLDLGLVVEDEDEDDHAHGSCG